jgi:hypothetical protein
MLLRGLQGAGVQEAGATGSSLGFGWSVLCGLDLLGWMKIPDGNLLHHDTQSHKVACEIQIRGLSVGFKQTVET